MDEKIRGIVLGTVKHSDRANVVTLYTRERGRMAVVSPVGTGRAARIRAARLQLLSVVEADIKLKAGRELPLLSQSSPVILWHSIYFEPSKCALVFFLSEFLNRFLREAPSDTLIWDYIYSELERLDRMDRGVGNFHLQFLLGIMETGGILPDYMGWRPGYWFDFRAGEFCSVKPLRGDGLEPEKSAYAARLLRVGRRGVGMMKLGRKERVAILEAMLDYIGTHYPGAASVSSIDILRELF